MFDGQTWDGNNLLLYRAEVSRKCETDGVQKVCVHAHQDLTIWADSRERNVRARLLFSHKFESKKNAEN